jgi:hypothetical protein
MFNLLKFVMSFAGSIGVAGDQTNLYIKDMYKVAYDVREKKDAKYPMIYNVKSGESVTGAGTKETQLLGADELDLEVTEGSDINFVSPIQGWVFYGKYYTYKKGVKFSFQAVEDDVKLGELVKKYAATWEDRAIVAKETLAATVFNSGRDLLGNAVFNGSHTGNTDPSGNLLYDSKPLFNLTGNARTTKGGGTYYNAVTGLAITPANFETLYSLATATNNKDEQDIVRSNPIDTALTRPGADAFSMQKILNTTRGLPGGQLNDVNPYYGLVDTHIAWDYLTVSGAWYLGKRQDDGLQFHERMNPEFDFFVDPRNKTYNASVVTRFGVFIRDWHKWVCGGGTYA